MKTFLRKAIALIALISFAGCGSETADERLANALKTDPATVQAILGEEEVAGEITVSGYIDNLELLNNAVMYLHRKYPDVKVNIDVYSISHPTNADDSQERTDYLTRLNTELMSGGGADIIQADIFPFLKYADRGYFEDMRTFMDLDTGFNKEDLRMNFLDAVTYKGGIYIFPLSGNFDFFAYDASLFNNEETGVLSAKEAFAFSELTDIAKDAFERNNRAYNMFGLTGVSYQDRFSIIPLLLTENYASFVDIPNKQAHFTDGRFESFLSSITEYCDKGYIKRVSEINDLYISGNLIITPDAPNPNPDERFFYKYESRHSHLRSRFVAPQLIF